MIIYILDEANIVPPENVTTLFNNLIALFCNSKNLQVVQLLFKMMVERRIQPTLATYTSLLNMYVDNNYFSSQ